MAWAFDTATTSGVASWSHTSTGTNLLGVVQVTSNVNGTAPSVTWNSVAMTQLSSTLKLPGSNNWQSSFYILGQATGAKTVAVTMNGGAGFVGGISASYTSISQTGQPDAAPVEGSANTATYSTSIITATANDLVIATIHDDAGQPTSVTGATNRAWTAGGGVNDGNAVSAGSFTQTFGGIGTANYSGIQVAFAQTAAVVTTVPLKALLGVGL